MGKNTEEPKRHGHVRRLVEETGITRDQAQDLIMLIGVDWSSLVREARILKKTRL